MSEPLVTTAIEHSRLMAFLTVHPDVDRMVEEVMARRPKPVTRKLPKRLLSRFSYDRDRSMTKLFRFLTHPPRWWTTLWFWESVAGLVLNLVILFVLIRIPGTGILQVSTLVSLGWNGCAAVLMYLQAREPKP